MGEELAAETTDAAEGASRFAGRQLGSYQLGSLLASGGMGEVYTAYDPRLRRDVAVKVVPAALAQEPDRLRRLEREARAAAALNHPNILAVHDIGMHDGVPFIVMELVLGETLAARLKRERPPLHAALDIAIQIADALAAVHAGGILHRDLKPLNVMLTPEGRVKVLDFGLAKVGAIDTGDTRTASVATESGRVFGTPAYMAPEQFSGGTMDARADIFSLGVMLFEMVTGKKPYAGRDLLSLMENMLTQPTPRADEVDRSVPAALSQAISRCLARNPDERYRTAANLRDDLARIRASLDDLDDVPAPGVIETITRALHRFTAGQFRKAAMVAAAGVLLAAVAAIWMWPAPAPRTDRPTIAVLPLTSVDNKPATDYVGVGIADALTTSLSKLSALSVVARETARDATRATAEPAKLARDLGADLLVRATVQRDGDRLRIEVALIQADGSILWSGTVEDAATNAEAIERRLADRIATALRIPITADERRQLAVPQTSNQAALESYWRGMSFLERTDEAGIQSAIASFEKAIALDPMYAIAHAGLGAAYVRRYGATNDPAWMAKATASVMRALEIDPSQDEVRLSLANVYRTTGRNGSAVEELRRVLADDPTNDEAHRRLGSIFESEGRQPEALEHFRAAIDRRPAYWLNHDALGLFYYRLGQFTDAISAFTRVTELRPDAAPSFQRLGTAYAAAGDKARARENLKRAIAITPDAASYSNLGTLYYTEERFEDAAQAYREAIRLRPNRALLHRNLGDAYRRLGRSADAQGEYATAVNLTRESLKVNPNDARLIAQLAVYEAKLGNHKEADTDIRRAMAANPSDAEVMFRRAVVLALAGNIDESMEALSDAVANGFSVDLVREDDDLAALRSLPAFLSIIPPEKKELPKGARP